MILVGCLFGVAGIFIAKFYALVDYWNPPYIFGRQFNVEDFIYGFFYGGIASELCEFVLGLEDSDKRVKKRYDLIFTFVLITALCFVVLVDKLGLNSITAHVIPPVIVGIYVVVLRRDLIKISLLSGLFLTIITVFVYYVILTIYPDSINEFWILDNLSGIMFFGVPIEEYIFSFALGFGAANFYELITGRVLRKVRSA